MDSLWYVTYVVQSIVTVITAATGDRVIVRRAELLHALRHFILPEDIMLELLERVLKAPTEVFLDQMPSTRSFKFFYRLESNRYLLAVVKVLPEGCFFSSMYPTGKTMRRKHKGMKKVKL